MMSTLFSELMDRILAVWVSLAPFLFLGAALAGIIHVILPSDFIRNALSGRRGIWRAVLIGVPLPLCSCGVIPAGLGLRRDGASEGATVGFLISTPQTGVDSVLVSASLLGLPFAIYKVVAAAITGLIGGLITDLFDRSGESNSGVKPGVIPVVDVVLSTQSQLAKEEIQPETSSRLYDVIRHERVF